MVLLCLPSDILNPDSNTQYRHINYVFSDRIFAEFWLLTSPEREQTRWRQQLKFLQSRKVISYMNGKSRLRNQVFVQTILHKIPRGDMKKSSIWPEIPGVTPYIPRGEAEWYIYGVTRGIQQNIPRDIFPISNEEIIPSEISHTSRGACLLAIISAICQECKSLFKRTFTLQIGLLHLLVLVKYTVLHSIKVFVLTFTQNNASGIVLRKSQNKHFYTRCKNGHERCYGLELSVY